jgi:F-type H+-transporting ATPase subunit b
MDEIIKVFGIEWKMIAIQVVNFGILLYILNRFLYRPLFRAMEERRVKIEKGIKDAEGAAVKLSQAEEERKRILAEVAKNAEISLESAKKHAEDERSKILKEAAEDKVKILSRAEREAQEEKKRVIEEGREEIVRISVLAAEKILRQKTS